MEGQVTMALDELVENILYYTDMLVDTAVAQESAATLGKLCNDIARQYRALGICGLLLHADTDLFFHGLIQAALTRKYYLTRCVQENHLEQPTRRTGFVGPFFDAVAAHQFGLARQLVALSPDQWREGYEYEDDFAYAYFLHRFIDFETDNNAVLKTTLDQFEQALEGDPAVRLDVCRALLTPDQDQFDESFAELLDDHEQRMSVIADPAQDSILTLEYTFEPNRWIFVEGLALLRIAERVGLQTEQEYLFCPSIARLRDYGPFVPDAFPYLALE